MFKLALPSCRQVMPMDDAHHLPKAAAGTHDRVEAQDTQHYGVGRFLLAATQIDALNRAAPAAR